MVVGAMDLGQVLTIVFTSVVAASTIVYAFLTWRLVSETRSMRKAQTDPRVSVHAVVNEQAGNGRIDLVIRNEGQGAAEEIHFDFEGDPTYFNNERPIDELPVLKHGLKYLGPQQEFRIILGHLLGETYRRAIEGPWTFKLRYKNVTGDQVEDLYIVDFSQFVGLMLTGPSPLKDIEKHLGAIQKDLHFVTTGFSKLHVLTQTKEEARREMEELMERQRKIRADKDGVESNRTNESQVE